MVTTSDSEKWQKTVQGIEAGQNNLSPDELSAFQTLKEFFNNGPFDSNESEVLIKVLNDALPSHSNHRLLQRVHLPNFINLCEAYFKREMETVTPPIFAPPLFVPPAPTMQPPTIQPPIPPSTPPPTFGGIPKDDIAHIQKSIDGIEKERNNLSPPEWSAFEVLRDNFRNGNFVSNESIDSVKILKNALPNYEKHRILQKVHLPNFIKLCEMYFKSEVQPFTPPLFTPPTFQPSVNPEITSPEPEIQKEQPIITEFTPPPAPHVISPDRQQSEKSNKNVPKSNKSLILIIISFALLIGAWQIYKNWNTVSSWNPISKLLGKTETTLPNDSISNNDKNSGTSSDFGFRNPNIAIDSLSENAVQVDTASVEQAKDSALTQTNHESAKTVSNNSSKTITKNYPFGIYKGNALNGYPEGNGKMTYNRQVQIAKQDTKLPPHIATSGDYFIGSWGNGDIISGTLYDRNGNVKEKILAPKRFSLHDISND